MKTFWPACRHVTQFLTTGVCCHIVLQPEELARVKASWCGKKLGVTDASADEAIAAASKALAADRSKSRVTFYYLVAKELGKLQSL